MESLAPVFASTAHSFTLISNQQAPTRQRLAWAPTCSRLFAIMIESCSRRPNMLCFSALYLLLLLLLLLVLLFGCHSAGLFQAC